MKYIKTWFQKYLSLPFLPMFLLFLVVIAGEGIIFIKELNNTPLSYVLYLLSAVLLVYVCVHTVRFLRSHLKRLLLNYKLTARILTDPVFRVRFILNASAVFNICYSLLKIFLGIWYRSFWPAAVGIYYLVLGIAKYLLLRYLRRETAGQNPLREFQWYRVCGCLLTALTLTLSGIIVQMLLQGNSYRYPGFLVFAMAAYAFYAVTISVINIRRYRRLHSPVISAAKVLSLSSALVSMLALETALIVQNDGGQKFFFLTTAILGTVVCTIILAMSTYMIIHSTRKLQELS